MLRANLEPASPAGGVRETKLICEAMQAWHGQKGQGEASWAWGLAGSGERGPWGSEAGGRISIPGSSERCTM